MLLLAAAPLAAGTYDSGSDALNTVAGGSSQLDLSSFPDVQNLVGTFTGGNVVDMTGAALNSSAFGPSVDTIVTRGIGGSGTLTIVALNLVSVNPVVRQSDNHRFTIQLCLSDTASDNGSITLTTTNGDGGTFDSSFPVLPKLVFTDLDGTDVVRIDCASNLCDALKVSSTATNWVHTGGTNNFDPNAQGINSLPTGNQTVNNCDGTHTVNIVAPGGFYPGWTLSASGFQTAKISDAARPFATSRGFTSTGTWDQHSANHKTLPPLDCFVAKSGTSRGPGAAPQAGIGVVPKKFCAVAGAATGSK